jgi:acetyl esterase
VAIEHRVTDAVVAGRDGNIPVRDYVPATLTAPTPLLWVHGGGFVLGGLDQVESDAPARYLAARGRRVRTIDYRLAPNIGLFGNPRLGVAPGRFPAAHHDVLDVAESLRKAAGPIALGGASAGANLAAGAVLALRDDGAVMPRSVVLPYGSFHSVLPENVAVESGLRGPLVRWMFNPAMTRRINLNYVGMESGLANMYAFPGGADLTGFPPTLTVDAAHDRLRRSGHDFHRRLVEAGVPANEIVLDARHGFLGTPKKPVFAQCMLAIDEWLARHDGGSPP